MYIGRKVHGTYKTKKKKNIAQSKQTITQRREEEGLRNEDKNEVKVRITWASERKFQRI